MEERKPLRDLIQLNGICEEDVSADYKSNHENENKAIEKENRPITIAEPIKPRRFVLECFDPLYTNSPVKSPIKKQQIFIECSSGEENSLTVMKNSDNENKEYQDANINITLSRETEKIAEDSMMRDHQKLKEEYKLTTSHFATLEKAFSDLNQRYERSKAITIAYKENEEALLKSIKSLEESLALQKNKYEALKEHTKTQIESSNKEILATKEQFTKLKAFVKRLEIKCASLESSLAQKTQECAALSELCDEVIRK